LLVKLGDGVLAKANILEIPTINLDSQYHQW